MALRLYFHPLSSHCHKVLIALYELDLPFERQLLNLGDPQERDAFLALWPTGKMPLLLDDGHMVPETSIIIEHLARSHGPDDASLLPADAEAALEARLMDRLFDLYVMQPMQAIVADRLRLPADRDPLAVPTAQATLSMAYGLLEQRLQQRAWAAGEQFSMADCTAAPALFYASTLSPFLAQHTVLAAYFERLVQRPSVARVLEEARPYFALYPFREAIPARFQQPAEAA